MTRERLQRGLSLVEVLVALAILTLTLTLALSLYDDARRSFKRGENVIEQQQQVRIAYDMITQDLRMAGFNHNPDGSKSRPDEAVEGAFDTAVVIRADFDGDTSDALTPEQDLEGGSFSTVSTGNDEIVAYFLAKPDGSSSDVLTFEADVAEQPRNGTVETVSILSVALTADDPPYTLYKVTLDDSGQPNSPIPLADNVRAMTFRYFDQRGDQVNAGFDLNDVGDDIGGSDADDPTCQGIAVSCKMVRAGIRRIEFQLEGITRDPDPDWSDTGDIYPATRAHRKFSLVGDIAPRNLGLRGMPDLFADMVPPEPPILDNPVVGHCDGFYLNWTESPGHEDVDYYTVHFGEYPGDLTEQRFSASNGMYLNGLEYDHQFAFRIQAVNRYGNMSSPSNQMIETVDDTTRPRIPDNIQISIGLEGRVELTWDQVTENNTDVDGDPETPRIRELNHYTVYRTTDPDERVDIQHIIADDVPPLENPFYTDTNVVNCEDYYYVVRTFDHCQYRSYRHDSIRGKAISAAAPTNPDTVQVYWAGPDSLRVSWQPVTRNELDEIIYVDTYRIYRSGFMLAGQQPSSDADYSFLLQVTLGDPSDPTEYVDTLTVPPGQTVFYQVTAVDRCPFESTRSIGAEPECTLMDSMVIEQPSEGQTFSAGASVATSVSMIGGMETYALLRLEFYNESTTNTTIVELSEPGPSWEYTGWTPSADPYTVTVTAVTDTNCTMRRSVRITVEEDDDSD